MSIWEAIKRMRGLDNRIVAAKAEIEEIRKKAIINNRFSIFDYDIVKTHLSRCEEINDYEKYSLFYDICKNMEEFNKLSIEDGTFINNLMNDKENYAAIHRTYLGSIDTKEGVPTNNILQSIMNEGLINNGHSMQGASQTVPSLSLTTTPLNSFEGLINLFASYKDNNATVLLQFPKELVEKDLSFKNNRIIDYIYTRQNNLFYIKPQFILGAIIKDRKQDTFYHREQLLENKSKRI